MVALGCLAGIGVVSLDALQKVIPRGKDSGSNLGALRLGYELWLERKAKQVP